ncbi:alpha/beta hydrolase [Novosphingobium barchaimii LL02]|uniref:Alpha/beta hydrolase n=1 Tax=Novosphingobium barchaimii LL02 TaxID=1114963 RepID=A0A0J7XYF8_9SPHN|nr:alpha/beta hydrolase [Novosphingobium barchaimii]KMS56512.1 alpha/beta hydrolase [Novosphingobium barchaimii LL02]
MNSSQLPAKPITRRGYADGPFGQVHYQNLGDGAPLLLLHQAPMTSSQFDYVYEPLARRGFRAIGIDMPGFGGSDATPDTPTIGDYAQVVPAVLDALGLEKAAILGHHTGALAATEAAVVFPSRVSALIINGPLLVDEAGLREFMEGLHEKEKAFHAEPEAGHIVNIVKVRDWLAKGAIPPERLSDYAVQALVGRGAYWWGHHAAFTYDQAARLPLVTQPAMILTNTGDVIHNHAPAAHALRPDFAYAALEGSGVDIVDEQPEAWADAVAAFLHPAGNTLQADITA